MHRFPTTPRLSKVRPLLSLAGMRVVSATLTSVLLLACSGNSQADANRKCSLKPASLITRSTAPGPTLPRALGFRYPSHPTILLVHVDPQGHPQSTSLVKSSGRTELDQLAQRLAMDSRYEPAQANCHAIPSRYRFTQAWNSSTI